MQRTGIIIQARTGSQRFADKVVRTFFEGASILELLLERLRRNRLGLPICVATTPAEADDVVAALAQRRGLATFRGDEQDVLARFIGAAEAHDYDAVVRVCADNPFLDLSLLEALVAQARTRRPDYLSHRVGTTPAILTHYGFFSEFATTGALRRAHASAADRRYREHVTNYLYTHPDAFDVAFLDAPEAVAAAQDVRLTVDTAEDFETAQQLYALLSERGLDVTVENVLHLLEARPELLRRMRDQIERYPKQ